jgi:putative endonuclease
MAVWHVYMIRCGNGSLYTGITTDVERRFSEHQAAGPRAARYLKGRAPLSLVLTAETGDRVTALRVERRIKGFSRARKERLIQDPASLGAIIDTLAVS